MSHGKISLLSLVVAASLGAGVPSDAKTLKWANDGDVITADIHSRNEAFVFAVMSNVYEPLVQRNDKFELVPTLATEWKLVQPDTWRFTLRQGVKFHDGSAFDADDVLFSYNRAKGPGSDVGGYLGTVKEIRKIDQYTVELVTTAPNPILPLELANWYMMDKEWCEKNNSARATDLSKAEETFANRNANGTGPYKLVEKVPDIKTVLRKNESYWGKIEGNVDEAVFQRVVNHPTRVAALLSGELDMIYNVPLQDIERVSKTQGFEVLKTPEMRIIYFGFDQARDELLESNVKGKNPFKDARVRKAFWHAIDTDVIGSRVMRGLSAPTGMMIAKEVNGYDKSIDQRPKFDLEAAKKLLAEAGYPNGFEVGMDCPNDRYINDEPICQAVVSMLARAGIKANLFAQTRGKFFQKILAPNYQTSFFMLGWTPGSGDAHNTLQNLIASRNPEKKQGIFNSGGYSNKRVDELTDLILTETDKEKRQKLINEALTIHRDEVGHIPLHQQVLVWAAKAGIKIVQQPNAAFPIRYVTMP